MYALCCYFLYGGSHYSRTLCVPLGTEVDSAEPASVSDDENKVTAADDSALPSTGPEDTADDKIDSSADASEK